MKSAVGILIMSFVAFVAAMPLIVRDIPDEKGDGSRILPIYRDDKNGAFTLRDQEEMAERLKNIPYESTTTNKPIKTEDEKYPGTLRHPEEMAKRLEGIPFETTTKTDDESYFTIGPIKTNDETYPGTLRHPEEIAKHLEGIPFVTTTDFE